MKENKYDEADFFETYARLPRSVEGLNAAREWYVLKNMLPDLQHKNVLDLGCGYGWHCVYAREQGADQVVGIDLSQRMIDQAKARSAGLDIDYRRMAIEDIDFEPEQFDVVFSSLAFHYIKDLEPVFRKIHRYLKTGGSFVFSMEHPVYTAIPEQNWFLDDAGNHLHWPLDHYHREGRRHTQFLGHEVIKYHRTLETILNLVIRSNFQIREISEPKPSQEIIEKYPEMKDQMRRPGFILIAAVK